MKARNLYVALALGAACGCDSRVDPGRTIGAPLIVRQDIYIDNGLSESRAVVGYTLAGRNRFVWARPAKDGTLRVEAEPLGAYEPIAAVKEIAPHGAASTLYEERVLVCARTAGSEPRFGLFRLNPWNNDTETFPELKYCERLQPQQDPFNPSLPTIVLGPRDVGPSNGGAPGEPSNGGAPGEPSNGGAGDGESPEQGYILAYLVHPQTECGVEFLEVPKKSAFQRASLRSIQVVPWDKGFVVASLFENVVHLCWREDAEACASKTDEPMRLACSDSVVIDLSPSAGEDFGFQETTLRPPLAATGSIANFYVHATQSPLVYRITITRPEKDSDPASDSDPQQDRDRKLQVDLARDLLSGTPLDFVTHPAVELEGASAGRMVEHVLALEQIEPDSDPEASVSRLRAIFGAGNDPLELELGFPANRITPIDNRDPKTREDEGGRKLAIVWQSAEPAAPATSLGVLDLGLLAEGPEQALETIAVPPYTQLEVLPPMQVVLARPLDGDAWETSLVDLATRKASPLPLAPRERLAAPPVLRDGAIVGLLERAKGANTPWRMVSWDRGAARRSVFELPAPREDFSLGEAADKEGHMLVTHRGVGGYLTYFKLCVDTACDGTGSVHRGFLFKEWED